jgi:predicted RNase H-like nuclease (RuvC/YqgF family)
MTKPKLRKNAEINPAQSPHDGIHTCSKGCSKPGCTRTLRDTIEEQDKQIEALKRDLLEKTAELRKSEEHNDALCERMQDLNSELFAASNINGKLHMKRVHDLNQMGGQCEEIARLKAEVERLTKMKQDLFDSNDQQVKHIERLTKAGDAMADWLDNQGNYGGITDAWHKAKEVQS